MFVSKALSRAEMCQKDAETSVFPKNFVKRTMALPPDTLFAPLRDLQFSDKEKQFIRQKVLAGQRKALFLRKMLFVGKISGYVGVATFAIVVFLGSYLPQQGGLFVQNGPFSTLIASQNNTAQADTIGRLLEIQGVVHVIKDGNIVPKTDISAGETVVLQPGAELVVQVRATTFATITGPAKFILEYIPETNQTIVNILEGSFIEVTTRITPPESQKTLLAIQPDEAKTPVVIKTKLVEVTPPQDQVSSFVINQQDETVEVSAKTGDILVKQLVTTIGDETPGETQRIEAGKTAHVDIQGIAIYIPEDEAQATQLAMQSKDLQIRYQMLTEPYAMTEETLADLENDLVTVDVADSILSQLTKKTEYVQEKKIFTPELLTSLTQTVHTNISAHNLAQMRERQGVNTNAYIIAYSNLLDQINRAYVLLGINQPATHTDSLDAGIVVTQNLLQHLESTYATPPSLREALLFIINGLSDLQATVDEPHQAADLPTDQTDSTILDDEKTEEPTTTGENL